MRVTDNRCHTTVPITGGAYMVFITAGAGKLMAQVANNWGLGCGAGKECNKSTTIDANNHVIVEHNHTMAVLW